MEVFIEHYYITSDTLPRDTEIRYVVSTHVADSNFFTKTYRGKFLFDTYTLVFIEPPPSLSSLEPSSQRTKHRSHRARRLCPHGIRRQ
jgi:hypothetical protein